MGDTTKIEWATHTFNPWIGCTKVSPGCKNCYAETLMDSRWGKVKWGKGNPRQRTSKANWFAPRRWNNEDPHTYQYRARIFCASLADWLDDEVPIEWLADLLKLIHETPHCDWLLLTKRPEHWKHRISLSQDWHFDYGSRDVCGWLQDWWKHGVAPCNVWMGTSVEDQQRADERIPELLKIPTKVRFLSVEPMLGRVRLASVCGLSFNRNPDHALSRQDGTGIDWVIIGGESGHGARPCDTNWIKSIVNECRTAGVSPFVKQLGSKPYTSPDHDGGTGFELTLKNKKGGDMEEWPHELRIREFPT